jgi:hypothetical protein
MTPPILFTQSDAEHANAEWKFNCGPAALCGVLGLTPNRVRPHLGSFDRVGYMNPTLMFSALASLGVRYTCKSSPLGESVVLWPKYGIARVQWAGPWTSNGVPIAARYQHTHWVGSYSSATHGLFVFDVNLMSTGGWARFQDWELLAIKIMNQIPRSSGDYWLTHAIEVVR